MRHTMFIISILISHTLFAAAWKLDKDHSTANFKIKHLVVSNVTGSISFTEGQFELDDSDFSKSKITATLDSNSINTSNAKRDDHLRAPDFFDTKKFPTMKFSSKKVEADGSNFKLIGDFTMHGVTKEVTLNCAKPTDAISFMGGMHRGFSATGKLNRKDFGVIWNKTLETGGLALGEDVELNIELELVQKGAEPTKPAKKT